MRFTFSVLFSHYTISVKHILCFASLSAVIKMTLSVLFSITFFLGLTSIPKGNKRRTTPQLPRK